MIDNKSGDNPHGYQAMNGKIAAKRRDNDKTDVSNTIHYRPHDTTENIRLNQKMKPQNLTSTYRVNGLAFRVKV